MAVGAGGVALSLPPPPPLVLLLSLAKLFNKLSHPLALSDADSP